MEKKSAIVVNPLNPIYVFNFFNGLEQINYNIMCEALILNWDCQQLFLIEHAIFILVFKKIKWKSYGPRI